MIRWTHFITTGGRLQWLRMQPVSVCNNYLLLQDAQIHALK